MSLSLPPTHFLAEKVDFDVEFSTTSSVDVSSFGLQTVHLRRRFGSSSKTQQNVVDADGIWKRQIHPDHA